MTDTFKTNQQARTQALSAIKTLGVQATSLLQYSSSGRVLVLASNHTVARVFADSLSSPLSATVLLLSTETNTLSADGRAVRVEGHLGNYSVYVGEEVKDAGQVYQADLILDLNEKPLLDMAMKPAGYLTATLDEASLAAAKLELRNLVGVFEKPKYFTYDSAKCAHSRNGVVACTQCLDVCPAVAIKDIGEMIEVDVYLCQGGGVCASVCPSGAITYNYPTLADMGARIRTLLKVYFEEGGENPCLIFHEENALPDNCLETHPNVLPLLVEEIGSVGYELWLSALAFGASRVLLFESSQTPEPVKEAIQSQISVTQEILASLDYTRDSIETVSDADEIITAGMPVVTPATHAIVDDKRQTFFMAVDHLHAQSSQEKSMALLPQGAAYGDALVDEKACTLCLSCVNVCPGNALQHGDGVPELCFIESNCVQCGMCVQACPEDAIWITPRLLFDAEARKTKRILLEDPPFCCVTCGKPFATLKAIEKIQDKLKGHWMFQNDKATQRLRMCADCRVIDLVQDPDAMEPDPRTNQH